MTGVPQTDPVPVRRTGHRSTQRWCGSHVQMQRRPALGLADAKRPVRIDPGRRFHQPADEFVVEPPQSAAGVQTQPDRPPAQVRHQYF